MYDLLITGSDGFIGKYLIKEFEKKKIKIYTVGKKLGDLKKNSVWKRLPKAKSIIHLANINKNKRDSFKFLEDNIKINKNVIKYCEEKKSKLIFASSLIYGKKSKLPINETNNPLYIDNFYILSKFISEKLFIISNLKNKTKVTILRLSNVYGYGQSKNFIIGKIISQIKKKNRIK